MSYPSSFPMERALLGFLMEGPAHGYALHQRADEALGRVWYMGMSNVYGTLKDLEESGHVEAVLDESSYPPRKVYTITAVGRDGFLAWVREPVAAVRDIRVEFLAKLYFFDRLELEGAPSFLRAQRALCQDRLEELERRAAETTDDRFDRVVSDFRRWRIRSTVEWLREWETRWH